MRLDCEFTYVSFGLALQYFVILSVCTVNLFRLFCYLPSIKRRPQKLFLVFASLHAVERLLYFALWPPLYQKTPESECQPGTSGAKSDEDATWMNVLGTVPPCFFLSAFSVNVFTFARIYHTVLGKGFRKFRVLTGFLLLCNLAVYSLTLTAIITDSQDMEYASVWSISSSYFLIAFLFLTYGILLYRGVTARVRETRESVFYQPYDLVSKRKRSKNNAQAAGKKKKLSEQGWGGAGPTFGQREFEDVPTDSDSDVPPQPVGPNPMKKIVLVASVCMVCFTVRSVLLPILSEWFGGNLDWYTILLYFELSEIIPMTFMLVIFEGRTPNENPDTPAAGTGTATNTESVTGVLAEAGMYHQLRFPAAEDDSNLPRQTIWGSGSGSGSGSSHSYSYNSAAARTSSASGAYGSAPATYGHHGAHNGYNPPPAAVYATAYAQPQPSQNQSLNSQLSRDRERERDLRTRASKGSAASAAAGGAGTSSPGRGSRAVSGAGASGAMPIGQPSATAAYSAYSSIPYGQAIAVPPSTSPRSATPSAGSSPASASGYVSPGIPRSAGSGSSGGAGSGAAGVSGGRSLDVTSQHVQHAGGGGGGAAAHASPHTTRSGPGSAARPAYGGTMDFSVFSYGDKAFRPDLLVLETND